MGHSHPQHPPNPTPPANSQPHAARRGRPVKPHSRQACPDLYSDSISMIPRQERETSRQGPRWRRRPRGNAPGTPTMTGAPPSAPLSASAGPQSPPQPAPWFPGARFWRWSRQAAGGWSSSSAKPWAAAVGSRRWLPGRAAGNKMLEQTLIPLSASRESHAIGRVARRGLPPSTRSSSPISSFPSRVGAPGVFDLHPGRLPDEPPGRPSRSSLAR